MFHFDPDKVYSMPPYFGGAPYDPAAYSTISQVKQLQFTYRTDGDSLSSFIPEQFTLLRPEITASYGEFHGVSFLNGSSYNVVQFTVPVQFHGHKDCITGNFVLVIWENRTIPICGGREESGMPKIPASIENIRTYEGIHHGIVSHEGKCFLKVSAQPKYPMSRQEILEKNVILKNINAFGLRCIPNVGKPGNALSEIILYPQSMVIETGYHCCGDIKWFPLSSEECLMQAHIISAMHDLPIRKILSVEYSCGKVFLYPSAGRVLE